ncbi:MAG: DPP IV N-terminal domain-containing protein [Kiritimatiellae bacterium]|nr:DPP IV N-terminal domain-containing protein [Kiritimatiellia bacterium]
MGRRRAGGVALLLLLLSESSAQSPRWNRLVFRADVRPRWSADGSSFWYRVRTGPEAWEYVRVCAVTGERRTGPDLASLGLWPPPPRKSSELDRVRRPTRHTGPETTIRFSNATPRRVELFWLNADGEPVSYGGVASGGEMVLQSFEGHVWLVRDAEQREDLAVVEAATEETVIAVDGPGRAPSPQVGGALQGGSPDGRWQAWVDRHRVWLRDLRDGSVRQLATGRDGEPAWDPLVQWSPDSTAFVVSHGRPVPARTIPLMETTPAGARPPRVIRVPYRKPGDPLPQAVPVLFRITQTGAHQWVAIETPLATNAARETLHIPVRWAADGREFYFDHDQRGHQVYRVLAVGARDAAVRCVVEETSPTFIDVAHKTWRHWLDRSNELIWMSERDGWCHLWLYDVRAGRPIRQLTRGEWVVREVLRVDEAAREVWFLASGLRAGEDPYHRHLCRVDLDGGEVVRLTEADGDHEIEFSPGGEWFVARWSRPDNPPVCELRRARDGRLVAVLERADISALLAAGWTLPERVRAPGRDGRTEIWGVVIRPARFDPQATYPVVEHVYAGPHGHHAPARFELLEREHEIANLGFVVVLADGMGTNHRGKRFHDVCWKNLRDGGFPDRIAWLRSVGATRPWMDLRRVGIYGGSAGGQNAVRALLDHADVYSVAVADCGCHDNRMDKRWWNEQWMGWPVDESYERSSNIADAHRLRGHLLLIVGELDRNVDPASTYQLVGALQRAARPFEFMPIIGAGHGAAETPYGAELRAAFLSRHLLRPAAPSTR